MQTAMTLRRRRRGRAGRPRRVHPGPRRRPDRRRRRHLLPRRRLSRSRAWAPTGATTPSARPTRDGSPRRPQRHLVLNTVVTEWSDTEATAISDVVFLLLGDSGWTIQLVGRYHDILHHDGRHVAVPPSCGHIRDRPSTTARGRHDRRPASTTTPSTSSGATSSWPTRTPTSTGCGRSARCAASRSRTSTWSPGTTRRSPSTTTPTPSRRATR